VICISYAAKIIYLFEDTLPFIAGQIAARSGLSWASCCAFFQGPARLNRPRQLFLASAGHWRRVAFRKSPVGRAFMIFRENTLRSDLSRVRPRPGFTAGNQQWPLSQRRKRNYRTGTFGADHSFLCRQRTSHGAANKIIWHAFVSRRRLWVLVDRNCHKSILQRAINQMTGAYPCT